MNKVEVVQEALKRRGYIVIWQGEHHPKYIVGDVIERVGAEGLEWGTRFRVIGPTTATDFDQQREIFEELEPKQKACDVAKYSWMNPVFWRVEPLQ